MKVNKEIAETFKLINKAAMSNVNAGEYQKAIEIFEQGKILEQKLGLKLQVAESNLNIGNIYYLMKNFDSAQKHIESALIIFKEQKNQGGMFTVYQTLGNIHFEKKEYRQSREIYEQCLKLHPDKMKEAICCFQLGTIHRLLKEYKKSQDLLNRSLALFEHLNHQQGIINCLEQRSMLFNIKGRPDLAFLDTRRKEELENNRESL